jgi:adenine-specific DNA-methyltransferase
MTLNGSMPALNESLALLVEAINCDHWALMQLLSSLSKKETYRRILCCPTYPVRTKTKDLEKRLWLFNDSVASDPHGISHVLALLYESTIAPEYRKKYGQYFTPPKIAEEAVSLLTPKPEDIVIDPGCGTGCFALEILDNLAEKGLSGAIDLKYLGVEKDPLLALSTALSLEWANAPSHWRVLYADFLSLTSEYLRKIGFGGASAIISNPPFVRYHKLGERSSLAEEFDISLFSGLHSYFLAHSARLLLNGRMIFILPLEMNETQYGSDLMKKLNHKFSVERRCVYHDKQSNAWGVADAREQRIGDRHKNVRATIVLFKHLTYESSIRISSPQDLPADKKTTTLNVIASVHRGISSGANGYFVLTNEYAEKMMIPEEYLTKVIPPKTPSVMLKNVFAMQDWEKLRNMGKPCLLLTIEPKTSPDKLPAAIVKYIKMGEREGIHRVPTCRNRKPWYSVRIPRAPPDCVFTYMFRHIPKFVLNKARVYNLTNLLGVYFELPNSSIRRMAGLGDFLNTEVIHWFDQGSVGRKYAGGLVKLEPHDLEKMPIRRNILKELGVSTLD